MNRPVMLFCCALFLFLGIKGMQSGFIPISPPTQTVSASNSVLPTLNMSSVRNNVPEVKTIIDTVYVDSSKYINKKHVPVREPKRVVQKKHVSSKKKQTVLIAIPRDRSKVPLDSVLKDTVNWETYSAVLKEHTI